MAQAHGMWQCQMANCGYIFNPERGDRGGKVPAGTRFEDLPEGWRCPVCRASKKAFKPLVSYGSAGNAAQSA